MSEQATTNKIRVGMIRVENHAYWFAPLMDDCDMLKLREVTPSVHMNFAYPYSPDSNVVPAVREFSIERIWDYDPARAQTFSSVFHGKPKVCQRFEEVGEDVDLVFINSCGSDGSEHLKFASPFLEKGQTVFVDKPMAFSYQQAREMINLSREHRAPMMSSSLLNFTPEGEALREETKRLGGARAGYVRGCAGWETREGLEGLIHGLTLIQNVFGAGAHSVRSSGNVLFEYMVIYYPDGREVVLNNHGFSHGRGHAFGLYCDVYTASYFPHGGDVRSRRIGNTSFLYSSVKLLRAVRDLTRTGKAAISLESTLELIQTIDAARIAHATGRQVSLSEIS